MDTNHIYSTLNSITAQALGSTAPAAVDSGSFISLGKAVLSSTVNTSAWLNTLAQRIFDTIISERAYRNKLSDMILTGSQFGAILQKIKIAMPEAEEDPSWTLTDGQSVDPWKVHKENVKQSLFVQRSPYLLEVTYPIYQLREAFLSEEAMARYLSAKTQETRNKLELIAEGMAKMTIATAAALNHGTSREVNLLAGFNRLTGMSYLKADIYNTPEVADQFLRYAVKTINSYSDYLTEMSVLYNDGTATRHTPKELQRLYMLSDFDRELGAYMQYAAYNDGYVQIGKHESVGFWQSPQARDSINIAANTVEGIAATEFDGLVGILFDRDAMGVYHELEMALTSPVNNRGAYYNVDYHMRRQWLIDTSENIITFVIADA